MPIRVLLVDDDESRSNALARLLTQADCEVVTRISVADDLEQAVDACRPELIILETSSPSRDILEGMAHLTEENPHAIVMFVDDEDEECIRRAVRAGVAAYVVKGLNPERVRPVLQLAMARFEEHQRFRDALRAAEQNLDDRRSIDRAKEKIADHYGVDSGQAYEILRTMAMDRNLKMREVADLVLDSEIS